MVKISGKLTHDGKEHIALSGLVIHEENLLDVVYLDTSMYKILLMLIHMAHVFEISGRPGDTDNPSQEELRRLSGGQ